MYENTFSLPRYSILNSFSRGILKLLQVEYCPKTRDNRIQERNQREGVKYK